jgi:hypothetical protein
MDWIYKAMLTAMTVAAVLMIAQLFGRRVAGLVAGMPVITVPALLWIASEQGGAFAAASAQGIFTACALAAVFAMVYERTARSRGPAVSILLSVAAAGLLLLLVHRLTDSGWMTAWITLGAAVALCLVALLTTPVVVRSNRSSQRLRGELGFTAALAGVISAVLSLAAPQVGPFWCGVFAALPLISGCALVHQHLTASATDRQHFVHGYAIGLLSKLLFAVVFSALAPEVGIVGASFAAVLLGVTSSVAGVQIWAVAAPRVSLLTAHRT